MNSAVPGRMTHVRGLPAAPCVAETPLDYLDSCQGALQRLSPPLNLWPCEGGVMVGVDSEI